MVKSGAEVAGISETKDQLDKKAAPLSPPLLNALFSPFAVEASQILLPTNVFPIPGDTECSKTFPLRRETLRRCDLFLPSRPNPRVWFQSHAWVAWIIDTTGSRLPEEIVTL
jgi:hypothetical protein